MESESIANNLEKFVWEPALVKINMISSATEAACLILSVDETVKNPQAEQSGQTPMRGRGRGRGN
jgi:T-complex protein 1 subunit eta